MKRQRVGLTILGIFACFFLLLSIVGFLQGINERKETAKTIIYKNVALHRFGGGFVLRHTCGSVPTHEYDIDTDRIRVDNLGRLLPSTGVSLVEIIAKHREVLLRLLGGTTGTPDSSAGARLREKLVEHSIHYATHDIKDLKPLLQSMRGPRGLRELGAAILGTISGYMGGYWLGAKYGMDCNAHLVREMLKEKAEWLKIERLYMSISLSTMQYGDPLHGNTQSVFDCDLPMAVAFKELEKKNREVSYSFRGADFAQLTDIKDLYQTLKASPCYREVEQRARPQRTEAMPGFMTPTVGPSSGMPCTAWGTAAITPLDLMSTVEPRERFCVGIRALLDESGWRLRPDAR